MSDNDNRNEDWLRTQRWDLPTNVDSLECLVPLAKLVTLPCWEAAPEGVKREVERRLAASRET